MASHKIITPEFRASYVHIWTPRKNESGKEVYECSGIFKPEDPGLAEMVKLWQEVKLAKWPNPKQSGLRSPFRKGIEDDGTNGGFDLSLNPAYEGMIIIAFRSSGRAVPVVDIHGKPISDQTKLFSGCYCRASVTAYAYNRSENKGVAFGLSSLMVLRPGEPLGGGMANAEAEFKEIIVPEDADNSAMFTEASAKALMDLM